MHRPLLVVQNRAKDFVTFFATQVQDAATVISHPVALIGIGAMGRGLLTRLHTARHEVRAFDIAEPGRTAAREGGALVVGSPSAAAQGAAFVHVIVPADAHVIAWCSGPTACSLPRSAAR